MTPYLIALWFYAVMASLVFGATVYETLVVHPAWSRNPPESFAGFVLPASRMNIPVFWIPVAQGYLLGGIAAVALSFRAGVLSTPLIVSGACAVITVGWTILYFRPRVAGFLGVGGVPTPPDRLPSAVRQWIALNWIRAALVVVSWIGVALALATGRGSLTVEAFVN